MIKNRTLEQVLSAFEAVHGDAFDYSAMEYTGWTKKIKIRCKKHGVVFEQSPMYHAKGQGCPKCRYEKSSAAGRQTIEQFIARSVAVHSNKYDYSKVVYKNAATKVTIICPIHGEFQAIPNEHVKGRECRECSIIKRSTAQKTTLEDFIKSARDIHGDKYDYSHVVYDTARKPVKIRCNTHQKFFMQAPGTHLSGKGCKYCANDRLREQRAASHQDFLDAATLAHGDRYDYSKVKYVNANTKVEVICKEHGSFFVKPWAHWNGSNCPLCPNETTLGFRQDIPATLYVLRCGDITKVGITNRPVEKRAEGISKSFGAEFSVIDTFYFDSGKECSEIETQLLRKFRGIYESPSNKFDGYTECFLNVDTEEFLSIIRDHINE